MLTSRIHDFENDVFIGLGLKKKKEISFTFSSAKDCHEFLGKCCLVKQNEFSVLERSAKIKGFLEKQHGCFS